MCFWPTSGLDQGLLRLISWRWNLSLDSYQPPLLYLFSFGFQIFFTFISILIFHTSGGSCHATNEEEVQKQPRKIIRNPEVNFKNIYRGIKHASPNDFQLIPSPHLEKFSHFCKCILCIWCIIERWSGVWCWQFGVYLSTDAVAHSDTHGTTRKVANYTTRY